MLIEINYRDGKSSDVLDSRIRETLETTLAHLTDRLTRVEVHLGDENAHKGGENDFYETVHEAAGKLKRTLSKTFEKLDAR